MKYPKAFATIKENLNRFNIGVSIVTGRRRKYIFCV